MSKQNIIGWALLTLVTSLWAWLLFLGPEFHSEEADAPTLVTKLIDLGSFFLLFGAILLPVRGQSILYRINHVIVAIGAFVLLARLLIFARNMLLNPDMQAAAPAWIGFGIMTLVFLFVVRKAWQSLKTNNAV